MILLLADGVSYQKILDLLDTTCACRKRRAGRSVFVRESSYPEAFAVPAVIALVRVYHKSCELRSVSGTCLR
jgi:hypothetical protein